MIFLYTLKLNTFFLLLFVYADADRNRTCILFQGLDFQSSGAHRLPQLHQALLGIEPRLPSYKEGVLKPLNYKAKKPILIFWLTEAPLGLAPRPTLSKRVILLLNYRAKESDFDSLVWLIFYIFSKKRKSYWELHPDQPFRRGIFFC